MVYISQFILNPKPRDVHEFNHFLRIPIETEEITNPIDSRGVQELHDQSLQMITKTTKVPYQCEYYLVYIRDVF